MTDISEAAALRALLCGKTGATDMRTLKAVHHGLVLLPDESPAWDGPAEDTSSHRAAG